MKEHQIMLNATEDVKEFVNAASKCDFDIDISYNRIIIDAKSLLGILSMDQMCIRDSPYMNFSSFFPLL